MDKKELLKKIENSKEEINLNTTIIDTIKIMLVSIGNFTYAIKASLVKDIYSNSTVHKIPFVPNYVRGLINKDGEPYTVIDLEMLFNQNIGYIELFLIINAGKDQISYMVDDVIDIIKIPSTEIFEITQELNIKYFSKYIDIDGDKIYLIDTEKIYSKLKSDIINE